MKNLKFKECIEAFEEGKTIVSMVTGRKFNEKIVRENDLVLTNEELRGLWEIVEEVRVLKQKHELVGRECKVVLVSNITGKERITNGIISKSGKVVFCIYKDYETIKGYIQ